MQDQETQVILKSLSNPTVQVGSLSITLIRVLEASAKRDGKLEHFMDVQLRLQLAGETRDVYLPGETGEATALGYAIRFHSAGDTQAAPNAPLESSAEVFVRVIR